MFHCPANLGDLPINLRWHCPQVTPTTGYRGVLAGPVVFVPTHYSGATVPCCRIATEGAVPCWCDDAPADVRRSAYIPIVTSHHDRFVALVSGAVGDIVEGWEIGTTVGVSHPGISRRPIVVEKLNGNTLARPQRDKMLQGAPHDISEYLCHMWQIRALTMHYGFRFRPSKKNMGQQKMKKKKPK
jgi:hypothetical protein